MKSLPFALCLLAFSLVTLPEIQAGGYVVTGWNDSNLGHAVAPFDDFDQDGCTDLLVGAPEYSGGRGRVQLISGKTGQVGFTFNGPTGSSAGWSLCRAGDINNDNRIEVLIGAPDAAGGGVVYVVDDGGNTLRIHSLAGHRFGTSVADLGDVDGDGHDDYAIGSDIDQIGSLRGRVYAYSGQTGAFLWLTYGQDLTSYFSRSMCRLGDVNGDGCDDLAVGEPGYDYGNPFIVVDGGAVRIVSGKTGFQLRNITGLTNKDSVLGTAVANAGDYDNDGKNDIVAGAPKYGAGGTVFVLSGHNGATLKQLTGAFANEDFGASVAGAGDLTGNGVLDFIVGAPEAKGSDGAVYVMSGSGPILDSTYGFNDRSGFSVACADFNGDGESDMAYGRPDSGVITDDGNVVVDFLCASAVRNYGTGHPGTLGIPSLTLDGDPLYGASRKLQMGNSRDRTAFGLILIGLSPLSVPTTKDGTLLVNFNWTSFQVLATGGKDLNFTVPSLTTCPGSLYVQTIVADPGASKGLAFSQGLEIKFGDLPMD